MRTSVVRGTPSRTFEMPTTQCANTRGSPEQSLTPLDLSPSCQTITCRAVAKETVRSPSLYWGWPRPAWWPTNSLSNLNKNCMQWIGQHRLSTTCINFFRPLVAKQHNWTESWVNGFRMLEAYQAVGIPRWSQIKTCQPDLQAFTTVSEVTGRGSQPSKTGVCSKGDLAAGQGLAQKAGHLADQSACSTTHTAAKI